MRKIYYNTLAEARKAKKQRDAKEDMIFHVFKINRGGHKGQYACVDCFEYQMYIIGFYSKKCVTIK